MSTAEEIKTMKDMKFKDLRPMIQDMMVMAGDTEEEVAKKMNDRTSFGDEADRDERLEKDLKKNYWIGLYKKANDELNSSFDRDLRKRARQNRIAKRDKEKTWRAKIDAGGTLEDGPMRDWAETHGYVEDEWAQGAPGKIPGDDTYQVAADDLPTMTDREKLAARREAVNLPADATEKEVKTSERKHSLVNKVGLPLTATDDEVSSAERRQMVALPVSATDDEVRAAERSLRKFDESKFSEERLRGYGLPVHATERDVKDVMQWGHEMLKGQRKGEEGPDYTRETVLANLGLKVSTEAVGELEGMPYLGTEQIDQDAKPELFARLTKADLQSAGGKRRRRRTKKRKSKKRKSKKRKSKKRTKRR